MDATKLRALPSDDLAAHIRSLSEKIFRVEFQKSYTGTEEIKNLRSLKRDLARAKTITREHEIVSAQANR